MKLGFKLRKLEISTEYIIRRLLNILNYLIWFVFDPRKFVAINKKKIKNLFVFDCSGIGDIVNTIGIIGAFKEKYPHVKVYFITKKSGLKIAKGNPALEKCTSDAEKNLWNTRVDAAIIITADEKNEKFIKRKTKRIVYIQPGSIDANIRFYNFYGIRRKFPRYYHLILRRFHCFELLGFKVPYKLRFYSSASDKATALKLYKKINPKKKRVVIICPGAAKADKAMKENLFSACSWPYEMWAELSDNLIEKYKCLILITGIESDEVHAKEIIARCKNKASIKSICGKTDVREFGEFAKLCDLVISVDTGTVHIATQVGTPVIDLMGAYPARLYCAWAPSKDLESSKAISIFHPEVCSGCRKYYCPEENNICMKAISVDEVFEIAEGLIKRR